MEHVDQGHPIGDCWLLASLGAIVRSGPGQDLIIRNIQDEGNGIYAVRLYGLTRINPRTGWQTYRINSRAGAAMPPGGGSPTTPAGAVCEECEALAQLQQDFRADVTPNASPSRILWVALYETAMMHHLGLTSYQQLTTVGDRTRGQRTLGVNAAAPAMRMIMGPQSQDLVTRVYSSRSDIPDMWRLITSCLERTGVTQPAAALTIASMVNFVSVPPDFPDRDIHGAVTPPGTVMSLNNNHQFTIKGVRVSDPGAYSRPEGAENHLYLRVRDPWGTDDGARTEQEITHAIDMPSVMRFFDLLAIFSIPNP